MILVRQEPYDAVRWALVPSAYNDRFRELAKEVPGMRWDGAKKAWVGYADSVDLVAKRLVKEHVAKVARTAPPPVHALSVSVRNAFKRDYQYNGVEFLVHHAGEGALLADDTGIGKSMQAIHAAHLLGGSTLIVCPALARSVWAGSKNRKGEIEKWFGVKPVVLSGTKPSPSFCSGTLAAARFTLIHYEILHAWAEQLLSFKTVIFDEIHYLMNERSRRSQAAKTVAARAANRIALSATPMTSRPRDLWNVVDTISPGRFGKAFGYFIRYCDAHKETVPQPGGGEKQVWNTSGKSHLDELNLRMKQFMLRRTKEDVRLEIPPKTRQIIELEVPRSAVSEDWSLDPKVLRMSLALAARGKVKQAAEIVQERLNEKSSVIVFTHERAVAREMQTALGERGIDAMLATGEQSQTQRYVAVESTAQKEAGCLIATIDAMGVSIDLSFADVVIFVELDYVPSKLLQAEGRAHRFGQKKPVLILYLIALETMDEAIRDAILSKLETFEEAIGPLDDNIKKDLRSSKKEMSEAEAIEALAAILRKAS